jgi:TRAP-type C4-dicarboxylate transport system substrate-binding protein
MRTPVRLLLAFLLLWAPAPAQTHTVKMATLVPENSSYFHILREMAQAWHQASGGRVKLVFYPGGRQGDDPDVVRKLRLGSLQGAVLASPGLAEIDRSVYALSLPLALDSYDEFYAVLEKLRPRLEAQMEAKGIVMLNWADGGWVQLFAKQPVTTPADLMKLKLFQWAGDPRTLEIWKAAGFNPRPAPFPELATGLQTGLLEAFMVPPQAAVITRHFEQARYLTDLKWAMVTVGTVITKAAWDKLPADCKPALLQAAQAAGAKWRAEIRRHGEGDVAAMQQAGLTVVALDGAAKAQWRKMIESVKGRIRGEFVPAEAYDEAIAYRDAFRSTKAHRK